MKIWRIVGPIVLGLLLSGGWIALNGAPRTVHDSWVHLYTSLSAEAQASPLILEGRVVAVTRTWTYRQVGFTQFSVLPITVLKGQVQSPSVLVDQTSVVLPQGSSSAQLVRPATDNPLMQVGDTYIFFLTPSGLGDGAYFPVAGPQGRYVVQNGRIYSLDHIAPAAIGETIQVDGVTPQAFEHSLGQ